MMWECFSLHAKILTPNDILLESVLLRKGLIAHVREPVSLVKNCEAKVTFIQIKNGQVAVSASELKF